MTPIASVAIAFGIAFMIIIVVVMIGYFIYLHS